ncbi:MAG: ABC transporter substrate-binding protein [Alphaproteobacteria bacterium]|nr:ABC transporter substrate-binding protein [Alphaproteobacteria bacterium]
MPSRLSRRQIAKGLAGLASAPALGALLPGRARAQAGGGATLVIGAVRTPGGFDGDALRPATREVVQQVYESLVRYARVEQPDGSYAIDPARVEPHLAEGWTVSADGKAVDITLRQGVKSFFGNELTAEDVAWGWNKSIAQRRTGQFIASVSNVESVAAISRYTARFALSAPSAIFLRALTSYVPAIYDSAEAKKHATTEDPWALKWMERNTAGFGAYHLQSLQQGQQAVFVANPNYFGPKPHFQRVIYRQLPSPAARLQLLKTGQIHWAEDLTQQQIADLAADRNFRVHQHAGTIMANVRMNAKFKPFDDIRVRRALAHAVDYAAINQAVFANQGIRARSILPPSIPGNEQSHYAFETDHDRARALLAEAGHADGIDIAINYGDELWFEESLAIQLRQSFARANIRLRLEKKTNADMRAGTAPNRRDIAFFPFRDSPFVLDPFYKLMIDAHPRGASNRNDFNNAEFTQLVDRGLRMADGPERQALASRAQAIHAEQVSWLYTFYPGHAQPVPASLRGYTWYPDYVPRWAELGPAP